MLLMYLTIELVRFKISCHSTCTNKLVIFLCCSVYVWPSRGTVSVVYILVVVQAVANLILSFCIIQKVSQNVVTCSSQFIFYSIWDYQHICFVFIFFEFLQQSMFTYF